MNRISFEKWCMEIASIVALRSPDPKLQVGSILVSRDFKRILGWGYNGPVSKQPNTRKSNEPGKSGFIHSEINCLINSSYESKGLLFVTTAPCENCARVIANSGKVEKVYYKEEYKESNEGLKILKHTHVLIEKI